MDSRGTWAVLGAIATVITIISFASGVLSLPDLVDRVDRSLSKPASTQTEMPALSNHVPASDVVSTGASGRFGDELGLSLALGKLVPQEASDIFVYGRYDSRLPRFAGYSATFLNLGPVGFENVNNCPLDSGRGLLARTRPRYASRVQIQAGHVYCVSVRRGERYAKLVVDNVWGSYGKYGLTVRYSLQRNGTAVFR